jgi:hypothetical protein
MIVHWPNVRKRVGSCHSIHNDWHGRAGVERECGLAKLRP